jgi:hypothetical protein
MHQLIIATFVTLTTACLAGGEVGYRVGVSAPAPDLVYVSPGVQVIADYDYPVFFADGLYWRYDGGIWYRSRTYTGGWAVSYNVPVAVRGIDRPAGYAHYRSTAVAHGRDHRMQGHQAVRDHRHANRR